MMRWSGGVWSWLCIFNLLFMTSLSCVAADEPKESVVEVEPYLWDFGKVSQGEVLEHIFVLKNDSQNTFNIKSVQTSCGCTTSDVEKTAVSPGESVNIQVKFNTKGYLGPVQQFVYVHTDQKDSPIIKLTLKADVKK